MARTADVPLPTVRNSAAARVKVYAAQTVRLCKLKEIVYYDASAVVSRQSVEQPCAVFCCRSGFAQMNNVNAVGEQTVKKLRLAVKKCGGSYYEPKHLSLLRIKEFREVIARYAGIEVKAITFEGL